jgi:hypothetical protein
LKLKYDDLLSNFAFNFNLRHYIGDDSFIWVKETITGENAEEEKK